MFSFQPVAFLAAVVTIVILFCIYKTIKAKKYGAAVLLALFIGLVWATSPIVFKPGDMTQVEQARFVVQKPLPERVTVEEPSNAESLEEDLESLRKESRAIEESINQ